MSPQFASILAAFIGVAGLAIGGMLSWMFAISRRVDKNEERVRGVAQQLREVPKRKSDHQ
jgi:hypothetical protein